MSGLLLISNYFYPTKRKNLLYYYFKYKTQNGLDVATTEAQYQYMADNYVKPIAKAIRESDHNKYPLEYYMGSGWDGLRTYGWDNYYDHENWVKLDKNTDTGYYKKQKEVKETTTFNKDDDCN